MFLRSCNFRLAHSALLAGIGFSIALGIIFGGGILPGVLHNEETAQAASWVLTWSDEFNGTAGQAVDSTKWSSNTGAWTDNNELEYYTNATNPSAPGFTTQNAYQDGNGNLVIQALKQSYGGRNYTSARITTSNSFSQAYGRMIARIQIPAGQGLWPAFWMIGNNYSSVGWPACGEIDIAEILGNAPAVVYGSAHGPGYSGSTITSSYKLNGGQTFANGFHILMVQWSQNPAQLQYYVDGHLYETITPANLPRGGVWEFNHPFFMILNLAVGGNWPGSPNASTPFPAKMLVDYVRVYQWE